MLTRVIVFGTLASAATVVFGFGYDVPILLITGIMVLAFLAGMAYGEMRGLLGKVKP